MSCLVQSLCCSSLGSSSLILPSTSSFLSFDARLLAVEEEEEEEEGKEECENIMVIGADVARLLPNLTRRPLLRRVAQTATVLPAP